MDQSETLINIDMSSDFLDKFKTVMIGIVAGIAVIAAVIATAGVALIVGATVTVTVGSLVMIVGAAIGTGVIAAVYYDATCLPTDLNLPMYSISAEEIFRGDILLFDVDFFNPKEVYAKMKTKSETDTNYSNSKRKWFF